MKLKKINLLLIITISSFSMVFGQTQTLDGFKSMHKNAIFPILEKNEVKGYTIFYRADKADRKNDNYGIIFYDENLNKVKDVNIVKPKNVTFLVSNSYNEEVFGLFFYNRKSKGSFEIEVYDKKLKKVASKILTDVSKMDKNTLDQLYKAQTSGESGANFAVNFLAVPKQGFVKTGTLGMNKGFTLEMFDNSLKSKWKYKTSESSKETESLFVYDITEEYIIGSLVRRPNSMSKKMNFYLVVFDVKSGKKIIDIPIEGDKNEQLSLTGLSFDAVKQEFEVIGDFYKSSDKPGVSKSIGFFIKRFSIDGKEKLKNFYSWDKDIKSKLPPEAKESVNKGFVNFTHRTVKSHDGKSYLVVEQYKTAVDGLGVAFNVIGGGYGNSMTKAVVGNMLIFALDKDMILEEVLFMPKHNYSVTLPPGADFYGIGIIGLLLQYYDGFSYQFTQLSNDRTTFNAVYVNKEKDDTKKKKMIIGNVYLDENGNLSTDKIDITSITNYNFVYPGKVGYLMVVDVLKKEKQLGLKLIKIN